MTSKQAITIFNKCYELLEHRRDIEPNLGITGRFPKEMSTKMSAEVSRVGVYLAEKAIKNVD